jgi:hypothetical protein
MNTNRIQKVLDIHNKTHENDQLYMQSYSEPGYDEDALVVVGNWNAHKRTGELLEKLGVECEWYDEWTTCGNCGKLVRTSPDSYSWAQSFECFDGDIKCKKCLLESDSSASEYLDWVSSQETLNTIVKDPSQYGWVKVKTCESGYHPGQNDDPKTVRKEYPDKIILFSLDCAEQFCTRWSVWIKEEEENDCDEDDCDE